MNKEIKEKWLIALRSGNYIQGRQVLRDSDNKFCCLGVLCDIIDKEAWVADDSNRRTPAFTYDGNRAVLPIHVMEITGIENCFGQLPKNEGPYTSLTNMNDGGKSFEEIADVIEEYF